MLRDNETPSDNSDDSAKFSINLSDASGTTEEESPVASPKDNREKLEMDAERAEKQEQSRRSSKGERKRRKSQPLSNTTSPTDKNPDVESEQDNAGFVNNQNTTEVLNEAARRLVETKVRDLKNEQKKKQDITFNLENPEQILKEAPSEPDLKTVGNNVDEATLFKSKPKILESSRLIKLNPTNKVPGVSVPSKPMQVTPVNVNVNNESSDVTENVTNDDDVPVAQESGNQENCK
ncbi:unnamed protein product [Schistosoma turkestanicum]|nr:unnamed protein product [Schistosoma turkestanicum]